MSLHGTNGRDETTRRRGERETRRASSWSDVALLAVVCGTLVAITWILARLAS